MDRLKFLIRAGAAGLASWFATFSYGVEQVAAPSEVNLVIADPHAYVFQFFGIHIPARTTSPLELLQEVKVELAARSPQLEIRPTSAAKAACFSNTSLDRTLKCYTFLWLAVRAANNRSDYQYKKQTNRNLSAYNRSIIRSVTHENPGI